MKNKKKIKQNKNMFGREELRCAESAIALPKKKIVKRQQNMMKSITNEETFCIALVLLHTYWRHVTKTIPEPAEKVKAIHAHFRCFNGTANDVVEAIGDNDMTIKRFFNESEVTITWVREVFYFMRSTMWSVRHLFPSLYPEQPARAGDMLEEISLFLFSDVLSGLMLMSRAQTGRRTSELAIISSFMSCHHDLASELLMCVSFFVMR